MSYNFTSINIRGLRNPKKRKATFEWLDRHNSHIVFLQEVYCNSSDIDIWAKEWGGTFFATHGSNHSRGALIGIKNTVDAKCVQIYDDNEGRLIGVQIDLCDSRYYLWNIYAPNNVNDRKQFLCNMSNIINELSTDGHTIIGGDFNTVLNPEIDKIGGVKPNPACANIINNFINDNELIDIWRAKHGQEKRYTWKQNNPHILCALDYWLIPVNFDAATNFVKILTVPKTDHLAVHMRISLDNVNKGSNYWKFNKKWLSNDKFVSGINIMLDECISMYRSNLSQAELWNLCKNNIRSFSIDFARDSNHHHKCKIADIEHKLQMAYVNIGKYPNDDEVKKAYNYLKFQYEVLNEHYMKGLQIRSKTKWIEEGEKSTKYFLNLEKNNAYRKSVSKLVNSDGNIITSQDLIIDEEIKFFSNLYKSQGTTPIESFNDFFDNVNTPELNDDDKELCNGALTMDECFNALRAMDHNKSPGYDGITAEFYRTFWDKVGPLVVDAFNESYNTGSLTKMQNRGIISLLHKGKGLPRDRLDNWRPITLLNIDYKIVSKSLAARLKQVLPSIVNNDQNGFIKGRSIHNNIRLIEDVLRYVDDCNIPGIMLCVDYRKAFDSIERDFILYALKKFNFGSSFIQWVSVILNNTTNCISNNGHISTFFDVECGVRQGCPIASLLFVASIELISCKIRQSNLIHGITLPMTDYPRNEVKISTFADDTTIFVNSINSLDHALTVLNEFATLSGLRINHGKSDAIWIGSLKNNTFKHGNVHWKLSPDNAIKVLGITFSPDTPLEKMNCNWDNKMNKIECSIRAWKMRGLSMIGRNLIVKSLLASQLTFIATAIHIPENITVKLNTMFIKFIWNRNEAVKRKTAISDYNMGGINMFHVSSFFDSLKMCWVKKIVDNDIAMWKNIALYNVNKLGIGNDMFNCNCIYKNVNTDCINIVNMMPYFYLNVIKTWFKTKKVYDMCEVNDVYNEIIWNNASIKLNNKTLFMKNWIKAGFAKLGQLFNDQGNFLSLHDLKKCMPLNSNLLIEYFTVRNALPSSWKSMRVRKININTSILFNDIPINECNTKVFRNAIIKSLSAPPICQNRWARRFPNHNFKWKHIWIALPDCTKEARLISLNWKIIHNIYPTKLLLHKMGKAQSDICNTCNVIDFTEHFFFFCKKVNVIWDHANNLISSHINCSFKFDVEDVLFGVHTYNANNKFINHVSAIAKLSISKFIYGNHPNLVFLFEAELRLRNMLI